MTTFAIISLVAMLLSMLIAALCAAQDSAITSSSLARATDMAEDGTATSARVVQILHQRQSYVSLAVFLRTVCETTSTVLCVTLFLETVGKLEGPGCGVPWALVYAAIISVLLSFIVVGVAARTLALRHPYQLLRATGWGLMGAGVLLRWLVKLLVITGNALTPGKGFKEGPFSTDIEFKEIVDMAQQRGVVEQDERAMIESVCELGENTARSAMVPRTDMVWIESTKTAGQAVSLAVKSGFSRIPVIGSTVDDVVGIVYLKDLIAQTYSATDGGASVKVNELMRPVWFVPDSKNLDDLLDEMKQRHNHIAILVDEYGGVAGLITIEDILEEIVGEIADEYDNSELLPIEYVAENQWRVSTRLTLDDLAELTEIRFPADVEEDVDTVGGLLAYVLGRVPLPGVEIEEYNLRMVAEAGQDRRGRRRVVTVLVTKYDGQAENDPSSSASSSSSSFSTTATTPTEEQEQQEDTAEAHAVSIDRS